MYNFEHCSQKPSMKKRESELCLKGIIDLEIVDLTTLTCFNLTALRNQNKFQILNLQNKFQVITLFSHSFCTITGKYHEQSAILPMGVNIWLSEESQKS